MISWNKSVGAVLIAFLLFVGAGCGDDDSDGATAPSGDQGSDDTAQDSTDVPPAPAGGGGGGGGGVLALGSETIELDSAFCYLQSQPSAGGGGNIELTGQGSGTNAEGEEVLVDFARYDEESMFTGDDITVDIGDVFSDDLLQYEARLELGTVALDGNVLSANDVPFINMDDGTEVIGSFRLEC